MKGCIGSRIGWHCRSRQRVRRRQSAKIDGYELRVWKRREGLDRDQPLHSNQSAKHVWRRKMAAVERNRPENNKKSWNASRFCVSSLRRGHANLLCIVPIFTSVGPKPHEGEDAAWRRLYLRSQPRVCRLWAHVCETRGSASTNVAGVFR